MGVREPRAAEAEDAVRVRIYVGSVASGDEFLEARELDFRGRIFIRREEWVSGRVSRTDRFRGSRNDLMRKS